MLLTKYKHDEWYYPLGYNAIKSDRSLLTVQRDLLSLLRLKRSPGLLLASSGSLLRLRFNPEDGDSVFLQNIAELLGYTALHSRTE